MMGDDRAHPFLNDADTEFGPQIAQQAWSKDEQPTEPQHHQHRSWKEVAGMAVSIILTALALAGVVITAVMYTRHRGDPSPPAHTTPTRTTTTTTTIDRDHDPRILAVGQAFQAIYAKPGETVPKLQDALSDDHYILKVDLGAASTVVAQLKTQGIWMGLDWSTGAITEFSTEGQEPMDWLQSYFNLRLTPQRWQLDSLFSHIKWTA
ncbi:MAG: hypothetical protein ACLQLO_27725 [Mycobacterium sp.]